MGRAWYYLKYILRKVLELIKVPFFLLFDSLAFVQPTPTSKKGTLILRCDAIGDYFLFRNLIKHCESVFGKDTYFLIRAPVAILYQTLDQVEMDRLIIFNPKKFEVNLGYRLTLLRRIRKSGFRTIVQPNYSKYFFIEDCIVRLSGSDQKIGIQSSNNNIGRIPQLIASHFYHEYHHLDDRITFEFLRNKEIASLICQQTIAQKFGTQIAHNQSSEIIIAPGAGATYRKWAPENFAELIVLLNQQGKTPFLIIGGSEDEQIAERIISGLKEKVNVISLCGRLNLMETIQHIANSSLLITNESGPAHIGAAVGTKTICISNGNHFGRFHPYPSSMKVKNHYVYPEALENEISAGNQENMKKRLKLRSVYDINTISVERVIKKVLEVS